MTERSARSTRQQVPSACLQCRKRKVKCSGNRPSCRRCSTQEIECVWDTEPDTSRVASIRKRKEELERENEDLHEILRFLYLRPEQEAIEIFKRLRISGDALHVLDIVRTGDLLLQRLIPPVDSHARLPEPMQTYYDTVDHSENSPDTSARPWSEVADDGVVSDLVAGFFQWDGPFLIAFVDEEGFLEDMRKRSPETARYCSSVLVNAICALRSHTSRRAQAHGRANRCDIRLAFFDEARRQLDFERGRVSLPTAEALFIMHLTAAVLGMDRATRMYHLAACDMVQQLEPPARRDSPGSIRDQQIFSRAVWGMYCFESILAFLYLRPSILPMPSTPRFFIDHEDPRILPSAPSTETRATKIFNATCDLSIIYNKAMEYNKGLESSKVGGDEDVYRRTCLFGELQLWREGIPHEVIETTPFDCSAYFLRAYEDQVILSIFRPLEPGVRLPHDGYVAELLMKYCGRSIDGIEEHERALSLEDCSRMVLVPLFNTAVTLVGLLHHPRSHELFARTCRLMRERINDLPLAGFLLQGLIAVAADNGDRIPEVAKPWFEGLEHDKDALDDVPISFVLPTPRSLRDSGDVGIQLGRLLSSYNRLSISE
ncbi:hypothetical protein LZ30DRAFT_607281 [Colletotrichum cereale]|nr:hypothetical protein LZ30DRAFT_607281 [Colletotrichum cereale]